MLVFISWSGDQSKYIAEALENWLKQVIQAVEPWISTDISKGLRWGPEIADRLEKSKVGIICLTKENLDAKWILYEAGALSKTKDAYVCTLLIGLNPTDIEQPLAQFQHTTVNKDEIKKLIYTINSVVQKCGENALAEPLLEDVFNTYWPKLEQALEQATKIESKEQKTERADRDILQEILEIVRNQERRNYLVDAQVDMPIVNMPSGSYYNQIPQGLSYQTLYGGNNALVARYLSGMQNIVQDDKSEEGQKGKEK